MRVRCRDEFEGMPHAMLRLMLPVRVLMRVLMRVLLLRLPMFQLLQPTNRCARE